MSRQTPSHRRQTSRAGLRVEGMTLLMLVTLVLATSPAAATVCRGSAAMAVPAPNHVSETSSSRVERERSASENSRLRRETSGQHSRSGSGAWAVLVQPVQLNALTGRLPAAVAGEPRALAGSNVREALLSLPPPRA